MVSSGMIEKPLLYEFQRDQYINFRLELQMPYGDHYLISQNYWKLEFYGSHRHLYLRSLNLLLIATFLIISSSIDLNLTGWMFCKERFNKISCEYSLLFRCFWIGFESTSLLSGNTQFSILFANNFNAELMLPFAMHYLNVFDISLSVDGFCIVFRNQSQKFWDNSTKHNILGFSLKKLKDNSIKTPLPLPYINVAGQ